MKQRPEAVDYMYGLFPTIAHIAKSPNGTKYVIHVPVCSFILILAYRLGPIFNPAVITLVTAFLVCINALIPPWIIEGLVKLCTGQGRPASKVTADLITTPGAVASALTMAGDEMRTIRELDERCKPDCAGWCARDAEVFIQSLRIMDTGSHSTSLLVTQMVGSEMLSE
jgi:hypothetical protein